MQLHSVLDKTSLSVLEAVKIELVSHYRGLTPLEREKGFETYYRSQHVRRKMAVVIGNHRHLLARPGKLRNFLDLATGVAKEMCRTHAVAIPEAIVIGLYRTLAGRVRHEVDIRRLELRIRRDLTYLGMVF